MLENKRVLNGLVGGQKGIVQMCDLTVDQLMQHANELSLQHWGVEYTGMIELTNRRWKNINGRYLAMVGPEAELIPESRIIVMSRKRNAERSIEEVLGTLLHELVHWRLHSTGVNHRDGHFEFIAECLRVGAPISQSLSAQFAFKRYMEKQA
jgi:predicted SprT family Zn-dependent metalloprotease